MDERLEDLRFAKNPKARIKILKGHFATTPVKLQKFLQQLTFLTQR